VQIEWKKGRTKVHENVGYLFLELYRSGCKFFVVLYLWGDGKREKERSRKVF
jgi:hypothetical protein